MHPVTTTTDNNRALIAHVRKPVIANLSMDKVCQAIQACLPTRSEPSGQSSHSVGTEWSEFVNLLEEGDNTSDVARSIQSLHLNNDLVLTSLGTMSIGGQSGNHPGCPSPQNQT